MARYAAVIRFQPGWIEPSDYCVNEVGDDEPLRVPL